jgi:hypothetical protein
MFANTVTFISNHKDTKAQRYGVTPLCLCGSFLNISLAVAISRLRGRPSPAMSIDAPCSSADSAALKDQLQAGLKEMRVAGQIETIESAIPICERVPHVIREMPVHHRRESPELPASQSAAVEIDVGESRDELSGSRSSLDEKMTPQFRYWEHYSALTIRNLSVGPSYMIPQVHVVGRLNLKRPESRNRASRTFPSGCSSNCSLLASSCA